MAFPGRRDPSCDRGKSRSCRILVVDTNIPSSWNRQLGEELGQNVSLRTSQIDDGWLGFCARSDGRTGWRALWPGGPTLLRWMLGRIGHEPGQGSLSGDDSPCGGYLFRAEIARSIERSRHPDTRNALGSVSLPPPIPPKGEPDHDHSHDAETKDGKHDASFPSPCRWS